MWFHGDIAVGNLLVQRRATLRRHRLRHLRRRRPRQRPQIAWTYFTATTAASSATRRPDDATWARARGWALWKALIMMSGVSGTDPEGLQARTLANVLEDPVTD